MGTVAQHPWTQVEPYRLSVDLYRKFRADGYLVVKGLVLPEHVDELRAHTEALADGRVLIPGFPFDPSETRAERVTKMLRIHMGHRDLELWERYLLYPRVLDVVQALTGPDVLAMQTMLFMKGPGANGQGVHQDSFYIPTFPDSLLGAWIAIDPADTDNGCLWMSRGSNVEPIYPPKSGYGYGDIALDQIAYVENVGGNQNPDLDPLNTLKSQVLGRYEALEVPVIAEPGDVVFFGGHILHRSLSNKTADRMRRCLVNHYCNARSYTPWDGGNPKHILARGNTHLEFARPKFGTPCAATDPERKSVSDGGFVPTMMMATPTNEMGEVMPSVDHEDH